QSYARIEVVAPSRDLLNILLDRAQRVGATLAHAADVRIEAAPADGVFPEDFYATTNLATQVKLGGRWVPVEKPEMDCGIAVDLDQGTARCVPLNEVRKGDMVVVGHQG